MGKNIIHLKKASSNLKAVKSQRKIKIIMARWVSRISKTSVG